jgi:uncharacterized protein
MAQSTNRSQFRSDGLANVLAEITPSGASSSPLMVFRNPVTGQGTSRDRMMYQQLSSPAMLQREELDALYMHWICRTVVDHIPDEITRAGWMIQMGMDSSAKEIPGIDTALRELEVEAHFNEALKSARQNGGSTILLYVNDGRSPDQPIDWENIEELEGLEPLDRWYMLPVYDPGIVRYSDPTHYELHMVYGQDSYPTKVHKDRVLRLNGKRLPFKLQQRNQGWGMSEMQPILEAVARYTGSLGDIGQMLADLDLFTHKIKGLATMLAAGKEDQVRQRLAVNDMSRSSYRGFAIDADKEDIEWNSRSCSGLSSIVDVIKADLIGATGFPSTLLFGESPQGIGATGRSEERDFSRKIETYRDLVVRKPLTRVVEIILRSKRGPTKGRLPKDWMVNFPTLFVMNEREIADLRARVAAVDWRYWQMGAVTSGEVSISRYGGPEYSIETTLDMSLREPDGSLKEEKVKELLRIQGKMDPDEQLEQQVQANQDQQNAKAKGIRNPTATGERSDPTNNEEGTMKQEGQKSISSGDPGGDQ